MCVAFTNIGNDYSLKIKKNYWQLCIDYESDKYILNFFLKKSSNGSSLQLKSYDTYSILS